MIVHVARDGAELGSFPREQLEQLAKEGRLQRTDLCWFEGMDDWLLLEDFLGTKAWKAKELIAASRRVQRRSPSQRPVRVRSDYRPIPSPAVSPVAAKETPTPNVPSSPWIFVITMIGAALIWGIAVWIKATHPPNPAEPLSELINQTPLPK